MMRWWLDRGVDGFRMDVINLISKDTALPDGLVHEAPCTATAGRSSCAGRASTSSSRRCTARSSRAATRSPDRRRDARRDRRAGPAVHRPGRAGARHGLPVRARGPRRRAARHDPPATCATSRPRSAAGRTGSPTSAGTASTGTTTTSRAPSRGSATTARAPRGLGEVPGHRAAPAPRHAVRLPGRGARHDQRAVRRDRATSATSSRSTTTPRPWPPAPTRTTCSRRCA